MSCNIHERLIKKWLQLIQQPPNVESAVSAYLLVEEHRDSCELCKIERSADRPKFEQSVKITFVIKLSVSR